MTKANPRNPIPFAERKSRLRGPVDLVTGRYPNFLFGARVGSYLPVFHFHEVTLPYLEPFLIYLMQNGYRTLDSREMGDYALGRSKITEPSVVLCFDDAWASVWTVVNPLLRRYNMRAITYAIPGRVQDAEDVRPVWQEPGHDPDIDCSENPFCTWPELRALQDEGFVDVQSHTWSHAKIFSCEKFESLILPETRMSLLDWPIISDPGEPVERLSRKKVFHPLLPTRSRMSDAYKHEVDPLVIKAIHDDTNAAPYLFSRYFCQIETEEDRNKAILYELARSKEELESRLGSTIRQICFPWAVCGSVAESLVKDVGYETAIADAMGGFRACKPGGNPHRIMRLKHNYIHALPGNPRTLFWRIGR